MPCDLRIQIQHTEAAHQHINRSRLWGRMGNSSLVLKTPTLAWPALKPGALKPQNAQATLPVLVGVLFVEQTQLYLS